MTWRAAVLASWAATLLPFPTSASGDLRDGLLGSACEQDLDCAGELSCFEALGASLDGRAPARGLCSLQCDTDASCAELFAHPLEGFDAVCRDVAGTRLCLEPCTFADAYNGIVKCHLREDIACADLGLSGPGYELGACVPQCSYDAQCGERFCNRGVGLCQDAPMQGDPLGATCDASADETSCAGLCVPLVPGAAGGASTGTCTDHCVSNGPLGCGWSGEGVPDAQCEVPEDWRTTISVGDRAHCIELCECDSDCGSDETWCKPAPFQYASSGKCVAKSLSTEHLPDCFEQPDLGSCHFGEVRTCRGDDGCFGTAPCLEDRSGYAACECVELLKPGEGGGGGAAGDAGAEAVGARQAGGTSPAGGKPNISGRTPAPSCQCSVRPHADSVAALVWLAALASSLVARRPKRCRPR